VELIGPYLAACALLVVAGVGKAAHPGDTARAAAEVLGGRAGTVRRAVRGGAVAEVLLGVAGLAVVTPAVAGAVAASYAGFAGFVLLARRRGGPLASCGCFGRPDTPPTGLHVVVDLALAGSALWVAVDAPAGWTARLLAGQPWDGVPLVLVSAVGVVVAGLALSGHGRLMAARRLVAGGAGGAGWAGGAGG
jgi:hypothetical protein